MDNPHMLSEVAVLLPTDGAGRSELVVDVVDVPLQVGLQIAAVATLCALEVFNLQVVVVVEVEGATLHTCMCCWLI